MAGRLGGWMEGLVSQLSAERSALGSWRKIEREMGNLSGEAEAGPEGRPLPRPALSPSIP